MAKGNERKREEALDAFIAKIAEVQQALAEIQEAADGHFDTNPDEVTWAHVGNVEHTLAQLKDALAFIRGEAR